MTAEGWSEAIAAFGDHLATTQRSSATSHGYLKHLGWLADSAPADPWELTTPQLASWIDARGWSRETRRKVTVSFRLFYAWGVATRRCEWAPTAGLPSAAPGKRGPERRPLPGAWAPAVEGFVEWGRSSARGEGTLGIRTFWLGRLSEVSADPWAVTTTQLAQWLSNPDWAPETKRAARASVRTFYKWAVKAGYLESSPAEDLEPVLLSRTLPKPAPEAALRAALAAADDRQRIALKLAAYGGLRRAEIAMLHVNQITETEILVVGKAGHHRRVPLNPDLADEIRAELARRRHGSQGSGFPDCASDSGWLFPSSGAGAVGTHITPAHLGKIVSACLPDGWTTHSLRHRFATAVYGVERDLLAVQQLLGHSKPETTSRYAAVPDGAKRAAVSAIGVRWGS